MSKVELELPPSASAVSLSGLVSERNAMGALTWGLCSAVAADDEAVLPATVPWRVKEEARRNRVEAFARLSSEISYLTEERRVVISEDRNRAAAEAVIAMETAAARAAAAAAAARASARERSNTRGQEVVPRRLLASKTASGRVAERLAELREDDSMRDELEKRVEEWRRTRADGKVEGKNFVSRNRQATKLNRTAEETVRLRQEKAAEHVAQYERRLEQVTTRRAEKQAARESEAKRMLDSALGRSFSASELLARRLGTTGAPRERAALARAERARRERWAMALVLGARSARMLDELLWRRHDRSRELETREAASVIQRAANSRALRRGVENFLGSVKTLRRNLIVMAFRWRLRRKVFAANAMMAFLRGVAEKSRIVKAVHTYTYNATRVQRAWQSYREVLDARRAVCSSQIDKLLRSKKSPETLMRPKDFKLWMAKVSGEMLRAVDESTAQRKEGSGGRPGKGPRRRGGQGRGDAMPAPPAKFLVVDFDCRMDALARMLRSRRVSHMRVLMVHSANLKRMEAESQARRDMVHARAQFAAAKVAPMERASSGVADLFSAMPNTEDLVALPAPSAMATPPAPKLLLSHDEMVTIITQAMLATADRIHAGDPVHASRSTRVEARRAAGQKKEAQATVAKAT